MARSRDLSKVLSSNTTLATDAEVAATYQTQAGTGLKKIIPSSVAVGSGTGSADSTGKVTFSGVSSLTLNDVFTSTYDDYVIKFRITSISADNQLSYYFRSAAAADLSSNNRSSYICWYGSTAVSGAAGDTVFVPPNQSVNGEFILDLNIARPLSTTNKQMTGLYFGHTTTGGGQRIVGITGSDNKTATAATGIRFLVSTGNMTGTVTVYGCN